MPFIFRIDRRIWWLTVSIADRSSRMRTEGLEAALASLRASITESRAVSVECLLLKPDLLSKWLFCVRKEEIWLKIILLSVFATNGRRDTRL